MKTVAAFSLCLCLTSVAIAADQLCGTASRCVALEYPDSRLTEFHKRVLESMQLPYKTEVREALTAVWWVPRTDAEEKEVQARVSQYSFAIRNCPRELWPRPDTPAGTIKSCPKN